jgi:ribosome recycling factor
MESVDDVLLEAEDRMQKSVEFMQEQFAGVRTGKASPSLVENINVEYYGTQTRLKEIAGISTPEPSLIVINAYDPTALAEIEKAVLGANLGVTPMNDGKIIRIPIPPLSEERRNELVKVAKRFAEEARVSIRNVRRDANDGIKSLEKSNKATVDDREDGLKEVQKLTDDYIKTVDDSLSERETQLLEG